MPILNTAPGARLGTVPVRALYRGSQKLAGLRNLATNPSFETTTGTVEVRRNYRIDPRSCADVVAGSSGVLSANGLVADARFVGGRPRKAVWSTSPTGTPYALIQGGLQTAVGDVWTISARYEVSGVSSVSAIGLGGGTPPTSTRVNGTIDNGDGTFTAWSTFTITGLGSGTGLTDPIMIFSAPSVGGYVVIGDVIIEKGPTLRPWFSGAYSPDSDLTAAWTGTVNASASVLSGLYDGSRTRNGGAIPVISTQWSSSRSKSLRAIPSVNSSNDSGIWVAGAYNIDSLSGFGVTFQAGKTYTISATIRLAAAITQSNGIANRSIQVIYNTVSGWTGSTGVYSNQAPNTAGVTRCSVTFTLPAAAVGCGVRLRNGGSIGQGDVWWDDLMIVEGTYIGPYRDGNSPGWAWEGTADASASYGLN